VERAQNFWRRCAGLVIGFINRYQYDIFFRTETHIIGLQLVLALLTLAIVLVGFNFFYRDIVGILLERLSQNIETRTISEATEIIIGELEYAKLRALIVLATVIIMLKVVFGYFIAGATLKPARTTLAAQKQFIGNIAHELRTPLSIIKTNIEIAMLDTIKDPEIETMLKSNVEELDRINSLINNLVSMNSLLNLEPIEFKRVDLGMVIDGAVEKLTDYANRRNITITLEKESPRMVKGNAVALEQIAMNLLKNAIAYTPQGGKIFVTVAPDYHHHVKLVVRDTGVGIEERDLMHIFEPFYRADRSRTRESGGSGLGLTIVNEIVKLHHGKIMIRSALKKGTTVTVLIPKAEAETKRLRTI
jgi:signal transduction histidine kinase